MPALCPPCPVCRSATDVRDLSAVFTSTELTYYICQACLHLWAQPRVKAASDDSGAERLSDAGTVSPVSESMAVRSPNG